MPDNVDLVPLAGQPPSHKASADALRAMARHDGVPRRAVINLLDRRIRCNDTTCVPYSIAKKGLEELTKLAALEYAPDIRVNAVAPGPVLSPPGSSTESARELAGNIPLDQLPTLGNIAEAVMFLLQADSITGQVIYVDGGQHLLGNGV